MMAFSPIGLIVGAALARDVKDRDRAGQIEILGGVLGTSPIGLIMLATLAKQATANEPTVPTRPTGPTGPTEASVPDVSESGTLAAAEAMLKSHGLILGRPQYVVSDSPQDDILGSSPEAGAIVPFGSEVSLLISAGLVVPTVAGMPLADAESVLDIAGFLVSVKRVDDPGTLDTVVHQDPAGGDLASTGDTVTVTATQTPAPKKPTQSAISAVEVPAQRPRRSRTKPATTSRAD